MQTSLKKNATILTLLMLVKKLFSILYKIPYQNLTGDAGFYVFQQIYPLIALLMLLTGFALPTVIASLLSDNHYSNAIKDKIKRNLWFFSLIAFTILFLGNNQIALIMGDVLLAPIIRAGSIHFLFLTPIAYMRGILQSRCETIKKIGLSVVIEQIIRVLAILLVLQLTTIRNLNYYQIAEFAFLFSLVSPVVTIMHLYLMKPIDDAQTFLPLKSAPQLFRKTIYLVLASGILIIFSFIDSFLVFNVLIQTESQLNAMVLKGILERGLPILQVGTFFVGSLVSLTMSMYDKATSTKKKNKAIGVGLIYILALAIPSTVGLIYVMPYLNASLFTDQNGTATLQIMVVQVLFYSITLLLIASLSKAEKQPFVQAALLVGIVSKLFLTVPLTQQMGIAGVALSSLLSIGIMSVIMLIASKHIFTLKINVSIFGICCSTFAMWLILSNLRPGLSFLNTGERFGFFNLLVVNATIGILVYSLIMAILITSFRIVGKITLQNDKKRKVQAYKVNESKKKHYEEMLSQKQNLEAQNQEMPIYGYWQNPNSHDHNEQVQNDTKNIQRKEVVKMRLDKFLKVSRIIKRRQTAKEVSDAGKISVNGRVAKSSTALNVGDEIALHYATRTLYVRVLEIKDSTKKEDADRMYEIIREEPV